VKNLPSLGKSDLSSIRESDLYPSGVVVAAQVAELAALLAFGVADHSREQWDEAAGACAQAQTLARRAAELGQRGAEAYVLARHALDDREEPPRPTTDQDQARRNWQLGVAVEHAAEAPLELAASAADIAELAQRISIHAVDDLRADAAVATLLAAAAARAAARLVEINLAVGEKRQAVTARGYAEAAAAAAASVEAADL